MKVLRTFTLLILGLTALAFLVMPAQAVLAYAQHRTWVPTTATVTHADGPPQFARTTARATRRIPTDCGLQYAYTVRGRTYAAERIGFEAPGILSGPAPTPCAVFRTRPYPEVGQRLPIRYDPAHPQRAVYLPAFPRTTVLSSLGVLAFLGGFFFLMTRRKKLDWVREIR